MSSLVERLRSLEAIIFSKYLIASIVALAVDVSLFLGLIAIMLAPAIASAISYSVGIIVHWALSSRMVFNGRIARGRGARAAQQAQFVLSAFVGLAVTTAIVAVGSYLGLDPRMAKVISVAVGFVAVWHLRNRYVFRTTNQKVSQLWPR